MNTGECGPTVSCRKRRKHILVNSSLCHRYIFIFHVSSLFSFKGKFYFQVIIYKKSEIQSSFYYPHNFASYLEAMVFSYRNTVVIIKSSTCAAELVVNSLYTSVIWIPDTWSLIPGHEIELIYITH